jgi:hypothetical protein
MQRRPTGACPSAWVYACLATAQPRLGDVLKRMPPIRSGFFRTTPHLHLIAPVALPCLVGPLPSGACVSRTELGAAADAYRGALIGRFERASFDLGRRHTSAYRPRLSPRDLPHTAACDLPLQPALHARILTGGDVEPHPLRAPEVRAKDCARRKHDSVAL